MLAARPARSTAWVIDLGTTPRASRSWARRFAVAWVALASAVLLGCGSRGAAHPEAAAPALPFATGGPWPGVELPGSTSRAHAPAGALRVALNRQALLVEGAELPIADRPSVGRRGFDVRYKALGNPEGIEIAPLRRVLASIAAESKGGQPGPLLLGLDFNVTYRTFTEVMYTVMAAKYADLWLAVDTGDGERAIAVPAPRQVGPGEMRLSTDFTVIVGQDGFYVKADKRALRSGCDDAGTGAVTVPKRGGYDYLGLTACAAKLKKGALVPAGSTAVLLTAGPDIELQVVVRAMDALRADDATPLFPNVVFTVLGGSK